MAQASYMGVAKGHIQWHGHATDVPFDVSFVLFLCHPAKQRP